MRNYLNIFDKVKMKDGRILTVQGLEFREFIAIEENTYQSKKDIVAIIEKDDLCPQCQGLRYIYNGFFEPQEACGMCNGLGYIENK